MEDGEKTIGEKDVPGRTIELIATILMSIAIAFSAFCAYEATRWSGVQATSFAEASSARIESTKASATAWQQLSYDASTLLNLSEAYLKGEEELVTTLSGRFLREEFRPYVEEWAALDPLENPEAPDTPFELPDFKNAEQDRSAELEQQASEKFTEATNANQNGDDYIMATVFFALVLFFAGISTKLDYRSIQKLVLLLATIGLLAGLLRMISLPFH